MWSPRTKFFAFSVAVHGGLALAIGEMKVKDLRAATSIEIAETKKPAPVKAAPPPPPKAEPPRPRAAPKAQAAAAEEIAPAPTDMNELPDFGLNLSGGVDGTGVALPVRGSAQAAARAAAPSVRAAPKQLLPAGAGPAKVDPCEEPPAKPKPRSVPQPAGTEAARAAGVEGKVRVQLTVDETGAVVDVKLLQGLGYGLDEAALAAARKAEFEPAVRCGKPTRATFNISMRFRL